MPRKSREDTGNSARCARQDWRNSRRYALVAAAAQSMNLVTNWGYVCHACCGMWSFRVSNSSSKVKDAVTVNRHSCGLTYSGWPSRGTILTSIVDALCLMSPGSCRRSGCQATRKKGHTSTSRMASRCFSGDMEVNVVGMGPRAAETRIVQRQKLSPQFSCSYLLPSLCNISLISYANSSVWVCGCVGVWV